MIRSSYFRKLNGWAKNTLATKTMAKSGHFWRVGNNSNIQVSEFSNCLICDIICTRKENVLECKNENDISTSLIDMV